MLLSDFDFDLPTELIATVPVEPRDHSRLLVVHRETKQWEHRRFHELGEYLRPGDLLVRNNTRVFPARIFGRTEDDKPFEIFLLEAKSKDLSSWICLARPGKKVRDGIKITLRDGSIAEVQSRDGNFWVQFPKVASFFPWLETVGDPPLPPYLKRAATEKDRETYQTVYAQTDGSIAAPTAGLHFTDRLLSQLSQGGIKIADLTLHVGYGTFSPIRVERLEDHRMHSEQYEIPPETFQAVQAAKRSGRVIAVGTTSLRALESIPLHGLTGATDIFISPGYSFHYLDGLVTNFHLPQSSLFILICALLGSEFAKATYQEAISRKYRFYSYGDAMLIL